MKPQLVVSKKVESFFITGGIRPFKPLWQPFLVPASCDRVDDTTIGPVIEPHMTFFWPRHNKQDHDVASRAAQSQRAIDMAILPHEVIQEIIKGHGVLRPGLGSPVVEILAAF